MGEVQQRRSATYQSAMGKVQRRRSAMVCLPWIIIIFLFNFATAQQQDPRTLNGGSVLAMAGDGCVALAVDKRFGSGSQVNARVFLAM
jgi:20S proteasome alpha/beta subunit